MNEWIRDQSRARGGASTTLLIVGLSSVAIVIGVVGFVAGVNARRAVDALRLDLENQGITLGELNENVSRVVGQMQHAVRQDLQSMDERLNAMVGKVNKLTEARPAPAARDMVVAGPAAVAPVSAPAPASEAAPKVSGKTYTVEEGDTFSRIAGKVGVSLPALIKANHDVDPQRIRVGQKINLP
jgi:LysM repeat protein